MAYCKQSVPSGFTHPETPTVLKNHRPFAAAVAHDFLHLRYIDDDTPMNAREFSGIEVTGQLLDCLPKHQALRTYMQADVVVRRLNPLDVAHLNE